MAQHNPSLREEALVMLRRGATNRAVAEQLNVPRGTVGWWRHEDRKRRGDRVDARRSSLCPICDGRPLDRGAYAYLLGLYLGDGYISHYAKHRVPSLLITMDDAWPGLQDAAVAALRAVFPHNAVCRQQCQGCQNLKVYFKHLDCLFPQHGPGKKHERTIELAIWQQEIVDEFPWEFIRGLVHSDGCRTTNWTEKIIGGVLKRYEYPRYFFSNASGDILRLFTDTLDAVGVEWRHTNQRRSVKNISVAKRASVALMDAHIGPKY
ncbi:helix-turn-helix domain-containing protein [Streptomyces sp. NPDC093109]|uniref:helix-turn-helix domain-containing protein n=1 Tax=Streptomyces sp. NPDC093109 TaxID=3154977 RepID=UPI00344C5144